MSVKVATNRLIVSSLRNQAVSYQQLLKNISDFQALGKRLVREAEAAQAFRQVKKLQELSAVLSNFPLKEYQLIGQYYLGWCGYSKGENTRHILEQVIEHSQTYKVKALIAMGAVEDASGDYGLATKYYSEALQYARTPSLIVQAARGVAVLKAKEGYNHRALKELEALWPVVRFADRHVQHQYLNSCAVEYGEVGRIREAQDICRVILASPYVIAYPEWRETSDEVDVKAYRLSRSAVSFAQKPIQQNVLYLPERSSDKDEYSPNPFQPQGIVVKLNTWKNKMVKEPNDNQNDDKPSIELDKMTNKDFLIEIVQRTSNKDMSEKKLRKILEYVLEVESEPED